MVLGDLFITDLSYVDMLFVIVLGWILVQLWQRPIDNFTFNTLQLNKDSVYHTFIIALVATAIFLVFVFNFDSILGNIVENDVSGNPLTPPAPPNPPSTASTSASSNTETLTMNELGQFITVQNGCACVRVF